ncbi:MAG: glycosyltransferase [Glaciihabitans sp.]
MKSETLAPIAPPPPTRVVLFDLAGPAPLLRPDDRYTAAMVVAVRDGIPRGSIDLDLLQGEPAIRRALEKLRDDTAEATPRPELFVPDSALPSISVVVCTMLERPDELEILLDVFAHVDYPRIEFLLVDNRRSIPVDDPLPDLIRTDPRVHSVRAVRPGISSARNAGVAAATGEIIVFTDDDVRVDPQWVRRIGARYASDPDLEAVTGLVLPSELKFPAQIWFERYYGGFYSARVFEPMTIQGAPRGSGPVRAAKAVVRGPAGEFLREMSIYGAGAFATGANMTYRRDVLTRLGGFDLALGTGTPSRGGEDLATVISLLWHGGKVGYEPASVVHHRHRRELDELLSQMDGNGIGFTAMLTSLIVHEPKHLLALSASAPAAALRLGKAGLNRVRRSRTATTSGRGSGTGTDQNPASAVSDAGEQYPRAMVTKETRAFPRGPLAYLRSRRQMRTWRPSPRVGAPDPSGSETAVSV